MTCHQKVTVLEESLWILEINVTCVSWIILWKKRGGKCILWCCVSINTSSPQEVWTLEDHMEMSFPRRWAILLGVWRDSSNSFRRGFRVRRVERVGLERVMLCLWTSVVWSNVNETISEKVVSSCWGSERHCLDDQILEQVCLPLTSAVSEHESGCVLELFTLERLITGITVHEPIHETDEHVDHPITVFEDNNVHGPLSLVNDRDLRFRQDGGSWGASEVQIVIILLRHCRSHFPVVRRAFPLPWIVWNTLLP